MSMCLAVVCCMVFWTKRGRIILKAFIMLSIVLLVFSVQGTSAEVNPASFESQGVVPTGYPVILGDQTLLLIREGIKGATAEERAKAISGRIKKLAKDPEFADQDN